MFWDICSLSSWLFALHFTCPLHELIHSFDFSPTYTIDSQALISTAQASLLNFRDLQSTDMPGNLHLRMILYHKLFFSLWSLLWQAVWQTCFTFSQPTTWWSSFLLPLLFPVNHQILHMWVLENRDFVLFGPQPQWLKQSPAHSRHSIHICYINE